MRTQCVIVSDHPKMDTILIENIDYYNRTVYIDIEKTCLQKIESLHQ